VIGGLLGLAFAAEDTAWYLVPIAGYGSDDGFGGGGRFELTRGEPDDTPYRVGWMAMSYATQSGYRDHQVRWDRTGLAQDRLRLTAFGSWRQWLHDGYYGLGGGTVRDPSAPDDYYTYNLFQPTARLTGRWALRDDYSVFGAVNPTWTEVTAYPDTLLSEAPAPGVAGGVAVWLSTGLVHDTRDVEADPSEGHLVQVAARVDATSGVGGPLVELRGFASMAPRLTLGARVLGEWLFGDVPFYEQVHWGGLTPIAGFGGGDTVRGIPSGRYRGPGKALLNTEARFRVAEVSVRDTSVALQLAPWGDVGAVGGSGPGAFVAAGGAVKLVVDEQFVGRVDVGVGRDKGPDGPLPSLGIYLEFDHLF